VAAGLAAGGAGSVAHGERKGAAESEGAALGEEEVVIQMVADGAVEGGQVVDMQTRKSSQMPKNQRLRRRAWRRLCAKNMMSGQMR
jgi:hypothetical protein